MSRNFGFNDLIYNGKVTWAGGASADTPKEIDIPLPVDLQSDGLYQVLVYNPSTETAITVQPQIKWIDIDDNVRYSDLNSYSVGKGVDIAKNIQGLLMGKGGRIKITNDSAITNSYTAHIQVRKI